MKKLLFTIIGILTAVVTTAQAPAFPGAEGHGRYVTGGRGGKIVHVTNLNDSGDGSFRDAVSGNDKKIVVFDVGGVIALNSELTIGANTTIAGQTAPYPGITIRYYTVRPGANNIIRFIRIRRGQERDVDDGADAIWQRNVTGLILDHCSFSWSIDEVASFYDNNNFTMQWCTLAESLNNAGHGKGAHGYGGIWGGKLASFHHNLIAHVANRSPRFNGARYNWAGYTNNQRYNEFQWANAVQAENVDFRNCVIYNSGNGCYGGPGGGQINIVNNYYKTGPATNTNYITKVTVGSNDNSENYPVYWGMTSRYYINGNQLNSTANADWGKVDYDNGVYTINNEKYSTDINHYYGNGVEYKKNTNNEDCVRIKMDAPTDFGTVTTHTATKAYDKVLTYAGASLDRDEVDTRYATETRNGTATYTGSVTGKKGRIDLVSDVNGYTEANFPTGSRATSYDTDNDGMPDEWETANGLDPDDASDAQTYTLDTEKQWYPNIEVYLNSIVEDIMKNENTDALSAVEEYYPSIGGSSSSEVTNTATYALNAGDTFTSGQTVEVLSGSDVIATITYGENGGDDFKAAKANSSVTGFTAFTEGNGVNGNSAGGTFYTIIPQYDGTIETAVVLNGGKAFYILENGTAMSDYNGITKNEKYYGTFSFEVKAGSTYKIYCAGSKLGFYGFNYTYTMKEEPLKPGDVNMDGKVTVTDVMLVVDEILQNHPSPFNKKNADVSGDGMITVVDAMQIVDIILTSP